MGLGNPYAYVGNNPVNTIDPTGQFGLSDITNFLADAARTADSIIEGAVNMVYDAVSSTVAYVTHRTRGFVSEVLPGITSDMFAILGRAGPALDEYLGRTPRLASSLPADYLGEAANALGDLNWKQGFQGVGDFFIEVGHTLVEWSAATGSFIKEEALQAKEIYWDRCYAALSPGEKFAISTFTFGARLPGRAFFGWRLPLNGPTLIPTYAVEAAAAGGAKAFGYAGLLGIGTGWLAGCSYRVMQDADHSLVWE